MWTADFFEKLDTTIAGYDLLTHPFYKAWAGGELTRDDLRHYARNYYHHVEAFPAYLAEFAGRLQNSPLKNAVSANMMDEQGLGQVNRPASRAHSELWLDFLEGMGGGRDVEKSPAIPQIEALTQFFHRIATDGAPEEALAAFYAYESQVPRIAAEKARGLREMYHADEKTCAYFTMHATADVFHSQVWRKQLRSRIESEPSTAEKALAAAGNASKALWEALDGIEEGRKTNFAA